MQEAHKQAEEFNDEKLTQETLKIIKKHKKFKTPLLMILEELQEKFNFIPEKSMLLISSELKVPLSKVYSAVTFYNELKTKKRGKHLIRLCLGTACYVKKNYDNLDFIKSLLNVEPGETTKDGLITLETVNCFGACSLAPLMEVDGVLISKINQEIIKNTVERIRRENKND
ncbi:MAG: NAD(P)H-dependent oxidoreductase subunit E [Candidatus Woesearchaeota archaeon]